MNLFYNSEKKTHPKELETTIQKDKEDESIEVIEFIRKDFEFDLEESLIPTLIPSDRVEEINSNTLEMEEISINYSKNYLDVTTIDYQY